jgi:hypothetical protein
MIHISDPFFPPLNHVPSCFRPSKTSTYTAVCCSLVSDCGFKRDDCNTSPCPPAPFLKGADCFVHMEAATIEAIVHYVDTERNHVDVSNTYVDYGDQTFDILFWLSSTLLVRLSSSLSYRCHRTDSVLTVSAVALLVCYSIFILSDPDNESWLLIRSCTIMWSLCIKRLSWSGLHHGIILNFYSFWCDIYLAVSCILYLTVFPSDLIRRSGADSELWYIAVQVVLDVPTETCRKTWPTTPSE